MSGISVIGGTGGLGKASVMRISKRAPLVIGYRSSQEKAEIIKKEIIENGGEASICFVDVTDRSSVKDFISFSSDSLGGLDAVVSIIGPPIPLKPFLHIDDNEIRQVYETDLFGSINIMKEAGVALAEQGGGAIIVFLTTAVLRTLESDGLSGCPKAAVASVMKLLARELGPSNVRLNGVAPGVIDAGIVHSSFEVDEVAKGVISDCLNKTPLQRMGSPEEIASLVDYLTTKDAAYISGQIIGVDGGYSA